MENLGRTTTSCLDGTRVRTVGQLFSRLNMCRSSSTRQKMQTSRAEQQTHLELCREVYEYQVVNGHHFHIEQPQGSEVFEEPVLGNIVLGTLRTVFDMCELCEVGKLRVPKGNKTS